MADINIIVGYETVQQADQAFRILDKTVKSTARSYEQAFNKITGWQKKFSNEQNKVNAALNTQHLAQQKSNKSARDSARAFEEAARAVEKDANALRSFRMASDSVYRNQQKTLQMKKLLKSAIVAETMTTEQAIVALKKYNAAQMSSNKIMGAAKNKMNGNNMAVQQLGYQFGDFAVQVQGGTSAFVAFSQQGAQLAGILPMIAAPLGLSMGLAVGLSAALGILIPIGSAVARMFFEMKDEAKKSADGVEALDQRVKAITDTLEKLSRLQIAMDLGITTEQLDLLDQQGVRIEEFVKTAEDAGSYLSRMAASWASSDMPFLNALSFLMFGATDADDVGRAAAAVIAAQDLVDKNAKRIAKEQSQLFQKRDLEGYRANLLLATELENGADSDVYYNTKNRISLQIFQEEIEAQVKLNELTEDQGRLLVEQEVQRMLIIDNDRERNKLSEKNIALAKAEADQMKSRAENMALGLSYAEKQDKLNDKQAAAVKKITDAVAKNTKSSQRKIILNRSELDILNNVAGAEEHLAILKAEYAREDHIAKLVGQGILGKNLDVAMEHYDYLVYQQTALDTLNEKEKARLDLIQLQVDLETKRGQSLDKLTGGNKEFFDPRNESGVSGVIFRDRGKPSDKSDTGTSTGKSQAETDAETIASFQKKLDLEDALFGKTEARQKVLQALGVDLAARAPKDAARMEAQIAETNELIAVEQRRQALVDSINGSIEDGFMAMSDGTKSVSDAFRTMAAEIVRELYKVYVMQVAIKALKLAMGIPFADGGVISGGSEVKAYADGGIVGGPTTFPMAGGKTGLMGEAGPEAIMPLKRGANGKLGVQAEGGSGDIYVTNNYSISANTSEDTKRLVTQTIQQAQPALTQAAKASIMNDRRRGGQMKSVFG